MKILLWLFGIAIISSMVPVYAFATDASMRCSPATSTLLVGQQVTVDLVVDTKDIQSTGAEINATYDPALVDAVSTQLDVLTDLTHWSTPSGTANTIDTALGKIHLDFGSVQATYSGVATVGRITFRGKSAGQMPFNYTFFQPDDNATPGVAKVWGTKSSSTVLNLLADINNCTYTIQSSVTPTVTLTPTITMTPTPTLIVSPTVEPVVSPTMITQLPRSGSGEELPLLALGAALLVVVGLWIPKFISS